MFCPKSHPWSPNQVCAPAHLAPTPTHNAQLSHLRRVHDPSTLPPRHFPPWPSSILLPVHGLLVPHRRLWLRLVPGPGPRRPRRVPPLVVRADRDHVEHLPPPATRTKWRGLAVFPSSPRTCWSVSHGSQSHRDRTLLVHPLHCLVFHMRCLYRTCDPRDHFYQGVLVQPVGTSFSTSAVKKTSYHTWETKLPRRPFPWLFHKKSRVYQAKLPFQSCIPKMIFWHKYFRSFKKKTKSEHEQNCNWKDESPHFCPTYFGRWNGTGGASDGFHLKLSNGRNIWAALSSLPSWPPLPRAGCNRRFCCSFAKGWSCPRIPFSVPNYHTQFLHTMSSSSPQVPVHFPKETLITAAQVCCTTRTEAIDKPLFLN